MTSGHYSTVLDHPLNPVWSLIRDFNDYPVYIEGVSESVIEDDRRGAGEGRRLTSLYRSSSPFGRAPPKIFVPSGDR